MDATEDEIKRLVNQARLKFHPDKNPNLSNKEFLVVERAWSVLRHPEKRKAYDALLRQQKIISRSAELPVQCDISFDQFHNECISTHNVDVKSPNQGLYCYWFPCRCGGSHILDDLAVLCQVPYAKCTDCSLLVHVLYPESH
ncbi:unnamed protein product [Schistosoma turkestanicum]|nr:unnamed protein product [Schistosoma turkestanicum]